MTVRPARMKFGVFMAPLHHHVGENPALSVRAGPGASSRSWTSSTSTRRGSASTTSGAVEIIAYPALMIAAAAQRTKRIMLGSGVVDLPLHNPYKVADRFNMLDNMTRGRAMLGVGTGALRADFTMIGLDPDEKRRMSEESLAAIMALLRAEGPVNMKTDWFELKDARLQIAPYTKPHLPVAVAGASSADGTPASGRYGIGLLSTGRYGDSMKETWSKVEEAAQRHGGRADRADWRVTKFFHLAETRQQALDDCRELFPKFTGAGLMGVTPDGVIDDRMPELAVERGGAIIGTPEDAIAGHRAAAGGLGRLRRVPRRHVRHRAPRPDAAQLRAVRALRSAVLPGPDADDARQPRVGRRYRRRARQDVCAGGRRGKQRNVTVNR